MSDNLEAAIGLVLGSLMVTGWFILGALRDIATELKKSREAAQNRWERS